MNEIDFLQGKEMLISEITVKTTGCNLDLILTVIHSGKIYRLIFKNISRFSVDDLSAPMEIQGFEIIDHFSNGWDKESRFEIRDFEEDKIRFFCECFNVECL